MSLKLKYRISRRLNGETVYLSEDDSWYDSECVTSHILFRSFNAAESFIKRSADLADGFFIIEPINH